MKLTKDMKSMIVKALVDKAVPQELQEKKKQILASLIYGRYVELAPKGWKNFIEFINLADTICIRRSAYSDIVINLITMIPVSDKNSYYKYGRVRGLLITEDDLNASESEVLNQLQELADMRESSKKLFSSIVEASNTDKQLLEMLPEAAPILADFDFGQSQRALVPVEQIEKARRVLANGSV